MAYEDFSTPNYVEVDPESDITISPDTKINVSTVDSDISAYVYKDKGLNHFDGDFKHWVTMYCSELSWNGSAIYHWGLANYINDLLWGLTNNEHQLHVNIFRWAGIYYIGCEEYYDDTLYRASYEISLSTPYYLEIERDESVEEFGTLYCRIYSDASRETRLTTLSIALHAKADLQYIYGISNCNGAFGGQSASGYTENLDLQPPVVGWTGKFCGVTDPSKILGVAVSGISKVMGVA